MLQERGKKIKSFLLLPTNLRFRGEKLYIFYFVLHFNDIVNNGFN